jgi:hypothetical protein
MYKFFIPLFFNLFIVILFFSNCNNEKKITFAEDIAPIIHANCTPCHRPGEAGPFPLITYDDVKKRTKMIRLVTSTRYMPPWPADKHYQQYANEKGLTDDEIYLIGRWIDNGAPMGDASMMPEQPQFPSGSELGTPDLVIKMRDSFHIKGNNTDHFLVMKLPYEIDRERYVRTIEFVPGNRNVLHHMNAHLIQYDENKKENVFDGEMAVNNELFTSAEYHKKLSLLHDDGTYPHMITSVANYLPGTSAQVYPDGIGGYKFTKKGALYLNSMHYGPTPVDEYDQSYFNIFFTDEPPERPLREVIMGTLGVSKVIPPLVIPPNEIKKFTTQLKITQDISLLTVNPHMHLIGKSFLAYAIKPGRDTIPLIKINDWNFRWQYFYTFKNMIKIPAGSVIIAEGIFDNTVNNPNNPFDPPQTVAERAGSMRTTDEMFQLIINYLPYQQGDEEISLENKKY